MRQFMRPRPIFIEKLERRLFFDGAFGLVVDGTADSDVLRVELSGAEILVWINGVESRFAVDSTSSLQINAINGDDSIEAAEKLPIDLRIDGGSGADTLIGGAGA